MQHAVDEQGRRAPHLAAGETALDVAADPREDASARPIGIEPLAVEAKLGSVATKMGILERLLAMEQQLVHVPEAVLECRRLDCGGRREGVRVDLRQRKMPEGEADAPAQSSLEALDRPKRLP